jgi:dTDP-glucose 4,6-dehydratase
MRVLITGMNGFIGHHVASLFLDETNWELVGLDRIDATSTLHRLRDIPHWKEHANRVKFVWHDLRAAINPTVDRAIGHVDVILHMAASTHVDRSIIDPMSFVMDNVVGTTNLLEWTKARKMMMSSIRKHPLFIHFGTDEIFGPAPEGTAYREWDRYNSGNPYAASKAGAEEMAVAFSNTYDLAMLCTHTMNVFGERQHAEKFIPKVIACVLREYVLTVHADAACAKAGSRFYLYARNVGQALKFLIEKHCEKQLPRCTKVNLVGECEIDNLSLAQMIAKLVGKPLKYEMVDFHSSRPGHDLRYALDGTVLKNMGFNFSLNLERSLAETVAWYMENPEWLA